MIHPRLACVNMKAVEGIHRGNSRSFSLFVHMSAQRTGWTCLSAYSWIYYTTFCFFALCGVASKKAVSNFKRFMTAHL